jgi:hypothetical protein
LGVLDLDRASAEDCDCTPGALENRQLGRPDTTRVNCELDDFNRDSLDFEIDTSLFASRVVRALDQVVEIPGKPRPCSDSTTCQSSTDSHGRCGPQWRRAQLIFTGEHGCLNAFDTICNTSHPDSDAYELNG